MLVVLGREALVARVHRQADQRLERLSFGGEGPNSPSVRVPAMFHVVTVHWDSDAWIEPQLDHVAKHLPTTRVFIVAPRSVGGTLRRILLRRRSRWFASRQARCIGRIVADQADDDDYLVFLDGDAFPIAPIDPDVLQGASLAAVRRDEDLGECYPHPCFCITTVGFWEEIGGTWQPGPVVPNSLGQPITDVGCTLLRILEDREESWRPLLRSNTVDLHPLWFGLYAGLVYHHGAGFRSRLEHVDAPGHKTINPRVAARSARSPQWLPLAHRAERAVRYRAAARRGRKLVGAGEFTAAADQLSDEVFGSILEHPDTFHERFQEASVH